MEKRNNLKGVILIYLIIILILSGMQIILFGPILSNVTANPSFVQTTESEFKSDSLDNVVVTSDGDVILKAQTNYIEDDFIDETNIGFKENVLLDTSNGEVSLAKIDTHLIGGGGNAIKQTSDGGYIIGGGHDYAFLTKTDDLGNLQWTQTFGGPQYDDGWDIDITSDEGYVIVGCTESYGSGGVNTFDDPASDVWLIKTDSLGNKEWDKTYGLKDNDEAGFSVQQTSDEGYIISGSNDEGLLLIKTNSVGNKLWEKTFNNGLLGFSVQETSEGGYIIAGVGDGACLIKTDSSGNLEWNSIFYPVAIGTFFSVDQTSDGGYIATGSIGYYDDILKQSYSDVILIKTDSSGNKQWEKEFEDGTEAKGESVLNTNDGGYILLTTIQSSGTSNARLIKTDSSGNLQWDDRFGGGHGYGRSAIETSDNGYAITGHWYGGTGLIKTNNEGNIDFTQGELISNNLIAKGNASMFVSFNINATIPDETNLKVQFSQDNLSWYNSAGTLNELDDLKDGLNSLNLSNLGWAGSSFYYKTEFNSDIEDVPTLHNIRLTYISYLSSGTLITQPYDSELESPIWNTINWTETIETKTDIKFQIKSSSTESDLSSKSFVGFDGNSDSDYRNPNQPIWSGHDGDRWIQLKVYFLTEDLSKSPILHDFEVTFSEEDEVAQKDSDGDGVDDNSDAFPNDPTEWADSDGDGYGDNSDAYPDDDTRHEIDPGDPDTDGDGFPDSTDDFPNDPTEWVDTDGDGYGDNSDEYPNDPSRHHDEPDEEDDDEGALGLGKLGNIDIMFIIIILVIIVIIIVIVLAIQNNEKDEPETEIKEDKSNEDSRKESKDRHSSKSKKKKSVKKKRKK
jgi:hypothetical protein